MDGQDSKLALKMLTGLRGAPAKRTEMKQSRDIRRCDTPFRKFAASKKDEKKQMLTEEQIITIKKAAVQLMSRKAMGGRRISTRARISSANARAHRRKALYRQSDSDALRAACAITFSARFADFTASDDQSVWLKTLKMGTVLDCD